MGNQQSGSGGEGGKKNDKGEKKKYEPPVPTRVGKKRKKTKGPDTASKLPMITPHTKCRLRLLKQERIKDYLLIHLLNYHYKISQILQNLITKLLQKSKRH